MGGFNVQETEGNRRNSADSPQVVSPPDDVWPPHASIEETVNANPNRNSANSPEVVSPPDDSWPSIDQKLNRNSALSPEAVEDIKDPAPKYVVVDDDDKYVISKEGDGAKFIDDEKAALNSPETIISDNPIIAISGPTIVRSADAEDPESNKSSEPRTICGLSRKLFIILLMVAIALIAGGIGGGIAGGLISNNKKNASQSTSSLNTSSSPSSGSPPPSSSPDINDPLLHIGEFNFQAFSAPNWSDKATEEITVPGNHTFPFEGKSYAWTNRNPGYDTGCCVTFCHNSFALGYWCQSKENSDVGETLTHVIIGCGPSSRNQAPCWLAMPSQRKQQS